MATPISPEMKKRSASEASGDASATMIRAEVKADDQIKAKASPIAIARMSMNVVFRSFARTFRQNGRGCKARRSQPFWVRVIAKFATVTATAGS
ncbi:hypothetical protein [Tateyamaria sp.]|uniref:hypothetical protein n=1 Tax=Tateyamaria sp. TaxID=1929288 RepID=UPI003B221680